MKSGTKELTFKDHLNELKFRSFIVMVNFLAGAIIGWVFHRQIEAILQKPLGQTLYYSNPAGGLAFVMQVAIGIGVITSLPLLLFQVMQFSRPAFKPMKTRVVLLCMICSLVLAAAAIAYVYFFSLPASLQFLVSFNSDSVQALIDVNDYIRFILAYCGGAIIAFQLPLILLFANKIRRFPPGGITKLQRPVVIGSIIGAGIITPTIDPINQLLLAGPIILLFELGAITVWIINRKERKRNRAPAPFVAPAVNHNEPFAHQPRVTPVATAGIAPQQTRSPRPLTMDIIRKPIHNVNV